MTTHHVVAILDRPVRNSLGMVGVVLSSDKGILRTSGVVDSVNQRLHEADLDLLVSGGHAARVPDLPTASAETIAGLWLGNEFEELASRHDVPLPTLPSQDSVTLQTGKVWVAPTRHVWRVIDSWILRAFQRVLQKENAELASLMAWASPDRAETRAARWSTLASKAQERELDWWVKLARDQGDPHVTRKDLVRTFSMLCDNARRAATQMVVGFSAYARGGDKEIAKYVASQTHLPQVSFGGWLLEKAKSRLGREPERLELQKLGQQIIDRHGALSLSLDVLDSIDSGLPLRQFLVEGIRHVGVYESVRSLVGPDRFYLAYVERSEEKRAELLQMKEGLSKKQIKRVMSDRTESEISQLKTRANIELRSDLGTRIEGDRLIESVRG